MCLDTILCCTCSSVSLFIENEIFKRADIQVSFHLIMEFIYRASYWTFIFLFKKQLCKNGVTLSDGVHFSLSYFHCYIKYLSDFSQDLFTILVQLSVQLK